MTNANQTTVIYHLTPVSMASIKKTKTSVGEDVEKKETLMHRLWECKLMQPLWRTVWKFPKTLKIEILYDPIIPLLSIYPKKMEMLTQKYSHPFLLQHYLQQPSYGSNLCPLIDDG